MARRTAPDPCDVGALLRAAIAAAGITAAEVARRTDIAPGNVSRALRNPDTSPRVARRILAAVGATLVVQIDTTTTTTKKGAAR